MNRLKQFLKLAQRRLINPNNNISGGIQEELSELRHSVENIKNTGLPQLTHSIEKNIIADLEKKNPYLARNVLPHPAIVKQVWLQLLALKNQELNFDDVQFSVHSQNGEDGILMYIFSKIGFDTRRSIEVGCDLSNSDISIPECNTANLISNFAFDGLILDKEEHNVSATQYFFARALQTKHFHSPSVGDMKSGMFSPKVFQAELNPENINDVIESQGFSGGIDYYSQDFDGPDVQTWSNLTAASPRVVSVEINSRLKLDEIHFGSWSTSDSAPDTLEFQTSMGSSLAAACQVGNDKGYVFVGLDPTLLNAFFVLKSDWEHSNLPVRTPQDYMKHRFYVRNKLDLE